MASIASSQSYNLDRFVEAQRGIYAQVLAELRDAHKRSHWMWYIFPQIHGLGRSSMARDYAISSLGEAKAYLEHAVLGPRLRECTQLVTEAEGRTVEGIFGYPDCLKFHSSMTLFTCVAADDQVFLAALKKYFNSELDSRTITRLRS